MKSTSLFGYMLLVGVFLACQLADDSFTKTALRESGTITTAGQQIQLNKTVLPQGAFIVVVNNQPVNEEARSKTYTRLRQPVATISFCAGHNED